MDNLAHTLLGAALSEAGLRKKTGLALPVLMISANLPDLDAITVLTGNHLFWRRGWTHGPLGLALLPILLALAVIAFDRFQASRGVRPEGRPPVHFGWVLVLAYIGTLSHPLLDFLNTYGIRCLMPFSDRWFYGDTLFIVDVWMWSILALGIWLARRGRRRGGTNTTTPARAAIVAITLYAGAMGLAGLMAERMVAREIVARGNPEPARVLASPVPVDPFRRQIVYQTGAAYGFGEVSWTPLPKLAFEPGLVPTNMDDPAVKAAARSDEAAAVFLYWSRFPFAVVERDGGLAKVTIGDARYDRRPGDGRFMVRATVAEPEPASAAAQQGQPAALPRE